MENDDEGVESNKKTRQVFGMVSWRFSCFVMVNIKLLVDSCNADGAKSAAVESSPHGARVESVGLCSRCYCTCQKGYQGESDAPRAEYVRKIVPLGLATCTCMFLGNYAYIGLSLSFYSILKATATVDETNKEADFHWLSFISFTTSILFEASRVVFVSIALKGTKYSSFDLLAGVGPLIFAVLSSLSLVMEWDTLVDLTSAEVIYLAYMMVLIVLLSFLVNISTYAAIKYSSSTTVKVVGCLKNALLMWFGILFQGDIVSKTQWQGFALSTGDSCCMHMPERSSSRKKK
eukprot:jgi/Picre1/32074/NNA_007422.t1